VQLTGTVAERTEPHPTNRELDAISNDTLEVHDAGRDPIDDAEPIDEEDPTQFDRWISQERVPEWYGSADVARPLDVIDRLRAEGFLAQPNHVFFAHSCGPSCPPHPALANQLARDLTGGVGANPLRAYSLGANPLRAYSLAASPLRAYPLRAYPLRAYPLRAYSFVNTAIPGDRPPLPTRAKLNLPSNRKVKVEVLDTGLPGVLATTMGGPMIDHRPQSFKNAPNVVRPVGSIDEPDALLPAGDPKAVRDGYLDPVAGHGVFIAGILESLAPGLDVTVRKVISPLGDVDEKTAAAAIKQVADATKKNGPPTIVTMSFGGPVRADAGLIGQRIAEVLGDGKPIVFVASAGNDGVCTPYYPAAFDGVISVGALGPDGPADFTNYGDWVDACAPGCDLVSWFFTEFNGQFPTINTQDLDGFSGSAVWSGTSFAAPIVAAKIATEFAHGVDENGNPIDVDEAVTRVVDGPHQTRIPCLGTVVTI
jgi:subtilisin family serine protease